jgi:hypothetical protein
MIQISRLFIVTTEDQAIEIKEVLNFLPIVPQKLVLQHWIA